MIPAAKALAMRDEDLPEEGGYKTVWLAPPDPKCDLCGQTEELPVGPPRPATYDARTTLGPWGCLCDEHFASHGVGLGTGFGQRLTNVPREQPPEPSPGDWGPDDWPGKARQREGGR